MDAISIFLTKFIALEETIFVAIFDRDDTKAKIIELNTQEQLFKRGVDNEGNPIEPEYTDFTKGLKAIDDEPFDHVTLKQSGKYHASFRVVVSSDGFIIESDPIKDGRSLFDKYGNNIEGLTEESFEVLKPMVVEAFMGAIEAIQV